MEDTVKKIRSLRETLENTFHAKLTLHDHIGIFTLPDGTKILPGINIHSSPCCAFWYSSRERCGEHCNYGATRRAAEEKKPFVASCFCGVTELVMPLFSGNIHAATIFAGMFRQKNLPHSPGQRGAALAQDRCCKTSLQKKDIRHHTEPKPHIG